MRKTKIVCTLGPATDREDVLREMMRAGMNVARFNFSHGSHEEHKARLDQLKKLREELDLPVAAMLDTRGPEVRLKTFAEGPVTLRTGAEFTLTTEDIAGDETRCAVTYAELPQDVKEGDTILLDDGLVRLTVLETTAASIRCRVENDGVMKNNKGVNIPNVRLSMPYMNQRDREDILFGAEEGFDFIAASFVRSAADVREIRRLLDQRDSQIRIIAKIENQEGISNLPEILAVADGVMVARGDLGVEIDFTEIPVIQKQMITQCVAAGKPVITATQMLDSMMRNPRPTRAEVSDVANAVYDGTSCVMLSGETAGGKYPVEALAAMLEIVTEAEASIDYWKRFQKQLVVTTSNNINDAITHTCCLTARDLNATAILAASSSGRTARMICRFRPACPVAALTMQEKTRRQLSICWGVIPFLTGEVNSTDRIFSLSAEVAVKEGLVQPGDTVVITAGVPLGKSGSTNLIKAQVIEDNTL